MTKILCITTGEFLTFLSSSKYDGIHRVADVYVSTLEDTHKFEYLKMSAEDIIQQYCTYITHGRFIKEEFEIIYD